jgi:nucleotidyltransferase/DNA polymerase involved in DNA repair
LPNDGTPETHRETLGCLAGYRIRETGAGVGWYALLPDLIWPLPASKVNGIGPKAAAKLEAMGIMTIGELAGADPAALQDAFGRTYSEWLLRAAHGIDRRPATTYRDSKSFSRETTFVRDLHPKATAER